MNYVTILLDILKYTIPALIVFATSYMIIRKFLISEIQRKQLAIFGDSQEVTLRLRLQAYERMVLFLERNTAPQLLRRCYSSEMSVLELQTAMVHTMNAEFEHNMSQQIYVSKNVWETYRTVKEQELNMINRVASSLHPDAAAKELYARILALMQEAEGELPTDTAKNIINDEARKVMSYGSY